MSPETASRQPAAATADTPKTPPHDSARPARDPHLESAFERLIGHQATPQDRARLHQVRDSLGLYPNDALWDVLIALQYYYSLYERFPAMIRGAARELLTECKNESDRNIAHAKQQVGRSNTGRTPPPSRWRKRRSRRTPRWRKPSSSPPAGSRSRPASPPAGPGCWVARRRWRWR